MHLFGIEESDVVFQIPCPACNESVGLSRNQVKAGAKEEGFSFSCPTGAKCFIPDLVLLREYVRLQPDMTPTLT